jgi:hypothetical protein
MLLSGEESANVESIYNEAAANRVNAVFLTKHF